MRLMRYTTGVAMAALIAGSAVGQSAAQTAASSRDGPHGRRGLSAVDDTIAGNTPEIDLAAEPYRIGGPIWATRPRP